MRRWLPLLFIFALTGSLFAAAKTETRLILSAETAKPGDTVWAGLQMKMPEGWHTYWQNGGDSGSPTKIKWLQLPSSIQAGPMAWPVPEKNITKIGDVVLITYVYEGEVLLLMPLQVAKDAAKGEVKLKHVVSWQECATLCVQGKLTNEVTLIIGDETKPSGDAALIEQWRKKLPQSMAAGDARAYWEGAGNVEARAMVIEWNSTAKSPDFFPYADAKFEVQGATEILPGNKLLLRKIVKKFEGEWPASVSGILVLDANTPTATAVEATLPIAAVAPVVAPTADGTTNAIAAEPTPNVAKNPPSEPPASLITMLLFAFIGGLILNVMPCVLPVIALKILGFVNQSKEQPQRVRQLGLVYGAGVIVSFIVLAILAIGVQHAGGLAGWGSAFRNPQFRVVITILITLVALNLFGVFEVTLGGGAMGTAVNLSSKHGFSGAFFNGVLATVLATPCTAPFLGAALTFAFTQPSYIILLVFLMVGLGLALPFVVLCWKPGLLKVLPKPGAWMEQFKVAMGFPMLATAMWLFWLTASRMGKAGVLWFGLFLVVLSLAAWIWGQFVQRSGRHRGIAMAVVLILIGSGYGYMLEANLHWRDPVGVVREKIQWQPWSLEAVAQARREGHPVLVDFTADWCLNCQLNKKTSLEIASTQEKLAELKTVNFIGDYTDADPAIGKQLQEYGRGGVPLVLIFPKDISKPAIVLPPLLTPAIVQKALDEATK